MIVVALELNFTLGTLATTIFIRMLMLLPMWLSILMYTQPLMLTLASVAGTAAVVVAVTVVTGAAVVAAVIMGVPGVLVVEAVAVVTVEVDTGKCYMQATCGE
jgi:hypothetical protein